GHSEQYGKQPNHTPPTRQAKPQVPQTTEVPAQPAPPPQQTTDRATPVPDHLSSNSPRQKEGGKRGKHGFPRSCYIMSGMPPGIPAPAFSFSGASATTASVVRMFFAIDAAFCSAERVTIVGSMIPAANRSST